MNSAKWESSDTSHRAVLRSAGELATSTFRRKSIAEGVDAILGKKDPADSTLVVQSLVFSTEKHADQAAAKQWLSDFPEVDKEYSGDDGAELDGKGIGEVGISKRLTMLQSAGAAGGDISKDAGVREPSAEQLRLINTLTRSEKTAGEVAIFPVLAANDIIDRDVDQFTPETIQGFMDLKGPLSPIGKSFMVGHDYRQLPVGRIFDGSAEKIEGVNWLKLWTYMPNTEQYKSYLENVDFGIYWAVSVGVMLGGATCSVGEDHEWGWHPYVCSLGHQKGERYDPKAVGERYDLAATDDNGSLCYRKLVDPQDFYELSQVYLGAQYYAAYSDKVAGAVSKSFQQGGSDMERGLALYESDAKILTLTSEEAAQLPHAYPEDSKIAAAHAAGIEIEELEDGSRKWVGEDELVWVFQPDGEELCLGKAADEEDDTEEEDAETEVVDETDDDAEKSHAYQDDGNGMCKVCGMGQESHNSQMAAEEVDQNAVLDTLVKLCGGIDTVKAAVGDDDEAQEQAAIAGVDNAVDMGIGCLESGDNAGALGYLWTAYELLMQSFGPILDDVASEVMGATGPEDEPTIDNMSEVSDEEAQLKSKTAVLRSVRSAKLPGSIIEAVVAADGDGFDEAFKAAGELHAEQEKAIRELTPKAALGEAYVKELRTDALHWFTMANKKPDAEGVDVSKFEKLLDLCGDNAELIKEQSNMYRDLAQAKFPAAVRRSTHPDASVGERHEVSSPEATAPGSTGAQRIHG